MCLDPDDMKAALDKLSQPEISPRLAAEMARDWQTALQYGKLMDALLDNILGSKHEK